MNSIDAELISHPLLMFAIFGRHVRAMRPGVRVPHTPNRHRIRARHAASTIRAWQFNAT